MGMTWGVAGNCTLVGASKVTGVGRDCEAAGVCTLGDGTGDTDCDRVGGVVAAVKKSLNCLMVLCRALSSARNGALG